MSRAFLTCPDKACEAPITRIMGRVDPKGGHTYYARPCGHSVERSLAREAHDAGWPVHLEPVTGATLVTAERARQHDEEGYTDEHDSEHAAELAWAAWSYLDRVAGVDEGNAAVDDPPPSMWPWGRDAWKPGPTAIRMLVKAGALICAEIDRRLAKGERP